MQQRVSIAPMMDYTDRHFRYLMRLISPHSILYTEMLTTKALIHNDPHHLLRFQENEQPLVLQLGGSCPDELAQCSILGESYGYQAINLNVGCPSPRVKSGRFGACLMLEPELVAQCVRRMKEACKLPITVKTRIGVDQYDSYTLFSQFIAEVAKAGCETFIIHARKALLNGLSPKENRQIPPLVPEYAYRLKQEFPHLTVIINGGIQDIPTIQQHLMHVDGVMLGREAYRRPLFFREIEEKIFHHTSHLPLGEILEKYMFYMQQELTQGTPLSLMLRHLLHLTTGQMGARRWRQILTEKMHAKISPDLIFATLTSFVEGVY